MAKHWIQNAVKHPGALHRMLGVKQGNKIPVSKIKHAANSSSTLLQRRAQFALNMRKINKKSAIKIPKQSLGLALKRAVSKMKKKQLVAKPAINPMFNTFKGTPKMSQPAPKWNMNMGGIKGMKLPNKPYPKRAMKKKGAVKKCSTCEMKRATKKKVSGRK